jgi:hypothetical protein
LKAIDIINFINEDKFSKYTAKQIYDELGAEDFIEYLRNLVLKAIKLTNLDYLVNIKPVVSKDYISNNMITMAFEHKENNYKEHLFVNFHVSGEYISVMSLVSRLSTRHRSPLYTVPSNETNIINRLTTIIKDTCESDEINKLRQKYLSQAKK